MQTRSRLTPPPDAHERLERAYQRDNTKSGPYFLFMTMFVVLMALAFALFGFRDVHLKFTSEVMPVHVHLNTIDDHRFERRPL